MQPNNKNILLDFAERQDRFEHEYGSELSTRIGLFLVFAGLVSTGAFTLLQLALEPAARSLNGWGVAVFCLFGSIILLFATMSVLLWAAFLRKYSAPARLSEYREQFAELLRYHGADTSEAQKHLREWFLDAATEAIDTNASQNSRKSQLIAWSSRLLLASLVMLFISLAFTVIPRFDLSPDPHRNDLQDTTTDTEQHSSGVDYEDKAEGEEEGKERSKTKAPTE